MHWIGFIVGAGVVVALIALVVRPRRGQQANNRKRVHTSSATSHSNDWGTHSHTDSGWGSSGDSSCGDSGGGGGDSGGGGD